MISVSPEEKAAVIGGWHAAPALPAANDQRFRVTVKRDGRSVQREVWATCWLDAWNDAYDEFGMACKIEVAPCPA